MRKQTIVWLCAVLALAVLGGAASAKEIKPVKAKNVIFYVADGMGPNTLGLLLNYARLAPGSIYKDRASNAEKFMQEASLGVMFTRTAGTIVTDSAASATQFASGAYTLPDRIGVDSNGNATVTVLEKAKKQGKSTGFVTTSYIQDATPAAFAAHQISRKNYTEISADIIKTGPDIVLGGGKDFFPQDLIEEASAKGYNFAFNKSELAPLHGKIIGLFGGLATPYVIERNTTQPNLTEMAQKALSELEKNKKGFFLMIEAGKIDWAAHDNDAGALLHELLEFDETLAYLVSYVKKNKDTLLIVLADHETGGFGFNYREAAEQDNPQAVFNGNYYVSFDALDKIYKQEAVDSQDGVVWASGNHISTPVYVMAYFGGRQTGYGGVYDTADLAKKVMISLSLK